MPLSCKRRSLTGDDEGGELKDRIDAADKDGSISREAIVQFRADDSSLSKQEADIRAKHDGLLPAKNGVMLSKERKKLIA